jgi:hydroxymethylbilane synthase
VPIAGHATLLDGRLTLCGLVSDLEGQTVIKATQVGRPEEAETIGRELADHLLERGARAVLDRLQTE